jgi:hypothetical protein
MSNAEVKRVFLVPVMIEVIADSAEDARSAVAGSLEHMMEVSNDEGDKRAITVYPAGDSGRAEPVEVDSIVSTPAEPDEPMRIVVCLDGGLVTSVVAAAPLDVLVVDYDVEGADEEDLDEIDQGDGTVADAAVSRWTEGDGGLTVSETRLNEIFDSVDLTD